MDQKSFNERIAMSLLRQCAWMWEHCIKNPIEGTFKLKDVLKGMGNKGYESNTGIAYVDINACKYWHLFGTDKCRIDGMKEYDRRKETVRMQFGDFQFSYRIADVMDVTKRFCDHNGCNALANKALFHYKDGERWATLPELKAPKKRKKPVAAKKTVARKPLSIEERLRKELRRQLFLAA